MNIFTKIELYFKLKSIGEAVLASLKKRWGIKETPANTTWREDIFKDAPMSKDKEKNEHTNKQG